MTKEEAIEFGNMWLQINEDCKDSSTYAFFKMAIEALKQESCEDVISRQYLIEKAINWEKHFHDSERYVTLTDIQNAPPVKPQESFNIETYCKEHFMVMVDKDVWEKAQKTLEQDNVLDKIRERIELEKLGYAPSAKYYKAIVKVLQIIDKCRNGE